MSKGRGSWIDRDNGRVIDRDRDCSEKSWGGGDGRVSSRSKISMGSMSTNMSISSFGDLSEMGLEGKAGVSMSSIGKRRMDMSLGSRDSYEWWYLHGRHAYHTRGRTALPGSSMHPSRGENCWYRHYRQGHQGDKASITTSAIASSTFATDASPSTLLPLSDWEYGKKRRLLAALYAQKQPPLEGEAHLPPSENAHLPGTGEINALSPPYGQSNQEGGRNAAQS
jgi:hypothetical protein